jgi:pyridoxamine 5'-phosphate oxidase
MDQGTARLEHSDPLVLFDEWLDEAWASEPDANAMSCATVDAEGVPSVRLVLLKGRDARGFVFYTNFESRKGRALRQHQQASLAFHWKSLRRQLRIDGATEAVADTEADAYFATRPRDSQIAAWASRQSEKMSERFELERRFAHYAVKFEGKSVPRPQYWSGFRVVPSRIEFWLDRPFRLHERIVFDRANDAWTVTRLYP